MMKHLVLRSWWLVLVFVAGCFSPEFQDGQIQCGPNQECPPGLECFGTVCRAEDPGIDASTTFPLTITLGGNMMGTVTSNPVGINCGSDCIEQFMSGTMVTLTASASSGSTFMGWSGACSGTGACTITVSTAINVTANFALDNSLTVVLAGTGSGLVSSNPAGISCGTNCNFQFPPSTMVTLTAFPATGSTFEGWSGAGCSGTGTCTVTTDAAKMVTATFSVTQHALTVVPAGTGTGIVSSAPTGISCGMDCNESYAYNTMVVLSAMPATGSTFAGWSGSGCTGTGTCTVTMTAAASVTATFTLTTHALTVMKAGAGDGTVTTTPAGINCGSDCTEAFDYNTMVTLSATPSTGSTFAGWSGGGCSGTAACTVTMTMATMVTASFTLNSYSLSVTKSGNGSGTVTGTGISCGADCSESLSFGAMITLTAAPAMGSTFAGWSGGGCTGTAPCTVMVTAATDVNATFTLSQHTISVVRNGTGTGTVNGIGITCGADCSELVDYNTTVTLTATPAAGSTFDGWTGGGCSGTGSCQTTVTAMTGITATFTLSTHALTVLKAGTGAGTVTSGVATPGINCGLDCNETYNYNTNVTLTAAATAGSTFSGWSGGGCTGTAPCVVTMLNATTVTATFTLTTQALTVNTVGGASSGNVTSSPAGVNCGNGGSDCNESYNYGTVVTLSATPASGFSFTGWSGVTGCTGTGSCLVTMDAAKTVTATFTAGSQSLSVTKVGTGAGTVTSNPMGINCGTTCSGTFTVGSTVVLTAVATAGSTFTGWSGGGCTGTGTCSVAITAGGVNVSATFTLTVHTLSVTKSGGGAGAVSSVPAGIACGANCNANYNFGTSVTLTATPAGNAVFTGWSGGGCTGTGTCTVTVNAATTVNANFELVQHTLTIKPTGDGRGTVVSNLAGIDCGADCDENYNDGTMVMLTATPDTGSQFVGWQDGCTGTVPMCVVTMNSGVTVVAEFAPRQYTLTVNRMPLAGGDVATTTDSGIDCGLDCTEAYDYNTFVSLKPSERSGYTFTGWSGACTGNGSCDLTMDADHTVTANFVITTHTLTVNRAGTGNGTVTSSPAGINCGADCQEVYNDGTVVQLTPAAATGSNFTSWSGCTSVTGTTCNVTMSSVRNVTATFTIQSFSLNFSKAGTGTGSVSFSPGTLVCGPTCSSAAASYNYNTTVTLTATQSIGSTFGGWSGACTNTTGTCVVSMTQVRNVTATFTAVPQNYVFVTSTTHNGNLGGLAGADMICQTRASGAGLTGTYRAYLSTSTTSAASRLGSAGGWIRRDGKPFADQLADLTSGRIFYPPRLDETGADVGSTEMIWTGSTASGAYNSSGGACTNWTVSSGTTGQFGVPHANSSMFSSWTSTGCAASGRLLCFGITNAAAATPPAVTARRAFTSNATWNPSTGIAQADALCAAEATANSYTGTFKALLATTTATALSRFPTLAPALPWARRDNTLVATTALGITNALLAASPNTNGANTASFGNVGVWTGATSLTSLGTAATTCNNWSNNTTGTGQNGKAGTSEGAVWFNSSNAGCASSFHLYCFEQ